MTNSSNTQLAYSLSDTPQALPADLQLVTPWAITGPADILAGSFQPPAVPWDGGANTAVGTGTLHSHTSHVFTVTAGVVIKPGIPTDPGSLVCGETSSTGDGIWNKVLVTNGITDDSAEPCTEVKAPPVQVVKADGSASQDINGLWTITYLVEVTNLGSTEPRTRDRHPAVRRASRCRAAHGRGTRT